MPAILIILASLALGGGASGSPVSKPAGTAKSLVVLVSVSVSPTSITEGQTATASATANVSSCGLEIDWGDGSSRTPTTAGEAQTHAFTKPGTYTVTANATGTAAVPGRRRSSCGRFSRPTSPPFRRSEATSASDATATPPSPK